MSSKEHQKLSNIIKGVSELLRKKYSQAEGDYGKVWLEHISESNIREQYANSMFKLATEVWSESDSRILWCHEVITNYYKDGLEKYAKKELYFLQKKNNNIVNLNPNIDQFRSDKCCVLDVGSCYNPFSKFKELHVIPLDLTPATEDVYKCDFLQLQIIPSSKSPLILSPPPGTLVQLVEESFHIIVFSLYLSYLPAAEQRFLSCQKAWKMLKKNGLLLIVTPDSKSQHRNSRMMKSWKIALEKIGFMRIKYEKKKHIHCMAYRKLIFETSEVFRDFSHDSKLMYIPQDFKDYTDSPILLCQNRDEDKSIEELFCELPLYDDLSDDHCMV